MGTSPQPISQKVLFHYYFPLNAQEWNERFRNIIPPGVCFGFNLAKIDNTHVTVSAGNLHASSKTTFDPESQRVSVIVRTEDSYQLTVSTVLKRIVLRYEWKLAEKWYAEFIALAPGSELSTDVIIGDCVFDGSTLTGFDYSGRTRGLIEKFNLLAPYKGIVDSYSDLEDYLTNNTLGDIMIVKNIPVATSASVTGTGDEPFVITGANSLIELGVNYLPEHIATLPLGTFSATQLASIINSLYNTHYGSEVLNCVANGTKLKLQTTLLGDKSVLSVLTMPAVTGIMSDNYYGTGCTFLPEGGLGLFIAKAVSGGTISSVWSLIAADKSETLFEEYFSTGIPRSRIRDEAIGTDQVEKTDDANKLQEDNYADGSVGILKQKHIPRYYADMRALPPHLLNIIPSIYTQGLAGATLRGITVFEDNVYVLNENNGPSLIYRCSLSALSDINSWTLVKTLSGTGSEGDACSITVMRYSGSIYYFIACNLGGAGNHCIRVYNESWNYISTYSVNMNNVFKITNDGTYIYGCRNGGAANTNRIFKLSWNGSVLALVTGLNIAGDRDDSYRGCFVDPYGNIWVVRVNTANEIRKYNNSLTTRLQTITTGLPSATNGYDCHYENGYIFLAVTGGGVFGWEVDRNGVVTSPAPSSTNPTIAIGETGTSNPWGLYYPNYLVVKDGLLLVTCTGSGDINGYVGAFYLFGRVTFNPKRWFNDDKLSFVVVNGKAFQFTVNKTISLFNRGLNGVIDNLTRRELKSLNTAIGEGSGGGQYSNNFLCLWAFSDENNNFMGFGVTHCPFARTTNPPIVSGNGVKGTTVVLKIDRDMYIGNTCLNFTIGSTVLISNVPGTFNTGNFGTVTGVTSDASGDFLTIDLANHAYLTNLNNSLVYSIVQINKFRPYVVDTVTRTRSLYKTSGGSSANYVLLSAALAINTNGNLRTVGSIEPGKVISLGGSDRASGFTNYSILMANFAGPSPGGNFSILHPIKASLPPTSIMALCEVYLSSGVITSPGIDIVFQNIWKEGGATSKALSFSKHIGGINAQMLDTDHERMVVSDSGLIYTYYSTGGGYGPPNVLITIDKIIEGEEYFEN